VLNIQQSNFAQAGALISHEPPLSSSVNALLCDGLPAASPEIARHLITIKSSENPGTAQRQKAGNAFQMHRDEKHSTGPSIFAVDPWTPGNPHARHQLLSDDERALLAKISSIVRFKKGEVIYEEGDAAEAAFNIVSGVVSTYRALAEGDHITSFAYQGDLFGLSEQGQYSNAARAATAVVAYKIPLPALRRLMHSRADLDVDLIVKLCEGLRSAQRHALLLAERRAPKKLAMFLELQEHLQIAKGEPASEIYLPMDRSSIAAYLGLTLAALSRAFRTLTLKQIISSRDRHHVRILDRDAFNRFADSRLDHASGA
jgi:CRP-like cAMP-binding protein